MSGWKRCWAGKHKMAQSISSCIPFTLYPPSLIPLQKKKVSQVRLFEDECTKGALKNNAKAEKPDQFIAPVFTKHQWDSSTTEFKDTLVEELS